VKNCSEGDLSRENENFRINTSRCLGTTCRKCEERCPEKKFSINNFKLESLDFVVM